MAELLLDSLEIENFRAFKHLKIERLGRVNLIVGKNSVGKTALLEALWLYANHGSFQTVVNILKARNELNRQAISGTQIEDGEAVIDALKSLFFGRQDIRNRHVTAKIGLATFSEKNLTIDIDKINFNGIKEDQEQYYNSDTSRTMVINNYRIVYSIKDLKLPNLFEGTVLEQGNKITPVRLEGQIVNNFVKVGGIGEVETNQLWSKITLTKLEYTIIQALQIIMPKVERVAVVTVSAASNSYSTLVKIENEEKPVSLQSLGDGLTRVFGISLALVNSEDGMLLVDEIENGLHFTTQLGLWRLIFAVARRLNVQVFATTHSWDCIQAFQQASSEDPEQGMVIRLNNVEGEITATSFDERRLSIVTREQIEVR